MTRSASPSARLDERLAAGAVRLDRRHVVARTTSGPQPRRVEVDHRDRRARRGAPPRSSSRPVPRRRRRSSRRRSLLRPRACRAGSTATVGGARRSRARRHVVVGSRSLVAGAAVAARPVRRALRLVQPSPAASTHRCSRPRRPGEPGRIYVVEQGGLVRVLERGRLRAAPFLDVRGSSSQAASRGLLGLAFPPDYARERAVRTSTTPRVQTARHVVARYRVANGKALPGVAQGAPARRAAVREPQRRQPRVRPGRAPLGRAG